MTLHRTLLRTLLPCLVALCLPSPGGAAPRAPQAPSVAALPSARAASTTAAIRVDGALDEPAWAQATPIGPLVQREPTEGAPASEETEVRVLYTATTLYFGILCRDRTPSDIVSTHLTRDAEL